MNIRRRRIMLLSKWTCYVLFFALSAVLQTMPGFLTIGGVKPIFILPVAMAVALCENEFSGAIFGAFCGLVWDMLAGRVMGFFAIGVMVCAFTVSVVAQLYLKENNTNFVLLSGAACFIVTGFDFLFRYLMQGYPNALIYYISVILPMIIFTSAISPLFLIISKKIHSAFDLS